MDSPMSPLEAFKTTSMQCLSPQDKLKSSSLLAHRTAAAAAATASAIASATVKKEATPVLDASSIDFDTCWVSDDTLLRTSLDLDDCLTQDIDWVVDDSNNVSFTLGLLDDASASDGSVDNTSDDDDETVRDFGFGSASRTATTYLSPLQNELSLDSNESTDEDIVASSFDYSVLRLEPLATDAETLLMSFDTMHFPLPSPTSSSTNKSDKSDMSTKRRARLFTTTSTAAKRQRLATTTSLVHSSPVASTNNSNNTEQMLDVLNLVVAPLQTATVSSVAATATSTNNNTKMIGAYNPDARRLRIAQFHAKRKRRTWKKSIKYDCRKKLADDRPRIKGRFVKVHDDCVVDCKVEPDGGEGGAMSPDSVVAFPPAIVATSPEAFVASASAVKEETTVETRSDSVRLAPAVAW